MLLLLLLLLNPLERVAVGSAAENDARPPYSAYLKPWSLSAAPDMMMDFLRCGLDASNNQLNNWLLIPVICFVFFYPISRRRRLRRACVALLGFSCIAVALASVFLRCPSTTTSSSALSALPLAAWRWPIPADSVAGGSSPFSSE